MPSSLDLFETVKKAIGELRRGNTFTIGSDFNISPADALDLIKLDYSALVGLNHDASVAKKVSEALSNSDFRPLGKLLGVHFVITDNTPSLFPNENL